ncbi:MAG: TraR/DksA C4-type zinc finger protein [Pseudomonadota bacterium]
MRNIDNAKVELEARRAEIDALEAAGADERATVTLDQQAIGRLARMDLLQRQQMAQETQRRRRLERARIEAALKRIAEDEYGWCAECGSRISDQRLTVDLTAHLCVDCAK